MSRFISAFGAPTGGEPDFFGDKYDELVEAAPIIEAAGALNVPMRPISQRMIDHVLRTSGLLTINETGGGDIEAEEVEERLAQTGLPYVVLAQLEEDARELSRVFGGPVIMRSSGRGDAEGTGTYKSEVHGTDPATISTAFRQVVASYFSPVGRIFRERTNLPPGFAMFMQPVVGNLLETRDEWANNCKVVVEPPQVFTTLYSGNVRIGTPRSRAGQMRMEEGFGSAVDPGWRPVFRFAERDFDDWSLDSLLIDADVDLNSQAWKDAKGFQATHDGGWGQVDERRFKPLLVDAEPLSFGGLKRVISTIHELAGTPLYLEFAVAEKNGRERLFVIQNGENKNPRGRDHGVLRSSCTNHQMVS